MLLSQVLCRRQKNNPLFVGEAGVGKTALAEGLARMITEKRVPEVLLDATIYALDMGTLIAGSNGSVMAFGMAKDLKTPYSDRLFVDAIGQIGYFAETVSYIDGNPNYAGRQAGSNDSAEDNYVVGVRNDYAKD